MDVAVPFPSTGALARAERVALAGADEDQDGANSNLGQYIGRYRIALRTGTSGMLEGRVGFEPTTRGLKVPCSNH